MSNLEALMAQQLVSLREKAGLSVMQLAEATDISAYMLASYERGKTHIDPEHLFKLCIHFGLTIEAFMKNLDR